MAKYYGTVGYAILSETKSGVYEEKIVEKKYYGEILKSSRSLQTANQVNDNINISVEISIISDPFAFLNLHAIRFVEYLGERWKVTTVTPQSPRIVLTVGGLYR